MITNDQHELLKDIITNTERADKLSVRLDPVSRTMTVEYDDMDDEWFKEMQALMPATALARNAGPNTGTTERMIAVPEREIMELEGCSDLKMGDRDYARDMCQKWLNSSQKPGG